MALHLYYVMLHIFKNFCGRIHRNYLVHVFSLDDGRLFYHSNVRLNHHALTANRLSQFHASFTLFSVPVFVSFHIHF